MKAIYVSNWWFEVTEDKDFWQLETIEDNGNIVCIKIRKKFPYKKHMKELVKELNKLMEK